MALYGNPCGCDDLRGLRALGTSSWRTSLHDLWRAGFAVLLLKGIMILDKQSHVQRPACVGMEEAAAIFGWPNYYLPFLVRAGHLRPLGKPAQNARKWFATVEIERMSCDLVWLDKAIRIVEKQIQEMNRNQRGRREHEEKGFEMCRE